MSIGSPDSSKGIGKQIHINPLVVFAKNSLAREDDVLGHAHETGVRHCRTQNGELEITAVLDKIIWQYQSVL